MPDTQDMPGAAGGKVSDPDLEAILGAGGGKGGFARRRWGWIVAAVIAAAVLAGGLYWAAAPSGGGVRYVTAKAARGDLTVLVTATGTVQPTNQVDVSSELSGIVRKVLVDYNSQVGVGQPLAELDTQKLSAAVASAKAKLAAARARVAQAQATVKETKLDYDRRVALVQRSVATARDLEAAKASHDRAIATLASARADVAAAEADLKVQETDLLKACICSPIDGVVLKRNVDPGQTVATSLQAPVLFTLAEDLRNMEVQVDVDEADVGKVTEGQKAVFTVDAYPNRKFPAVIKQLRYGSEVVQGVVTYKAVLSADNSDLVLRPGMTATAEITVREVKDALTVPNAALRFSPPAERAGNGGRGFLASLLPGRPRFRPASRRRQDGAQRTLWVLDGGAPVAVPVSVGVSDGKRTQIVKGAIEPRQAVIVDAVSRRK